MGVLWHGWIDAVVSSDRMPRTFKCPLIIPEKKHLGGIWPDKQNIYIYKIKV